MVTTSKCYRDIFLFSADVATSELSRDINVFITFNFMSQPHGDVATSFAFHFFSLGCDLFFSNYFPGRNIKVMLQHPFLLPSSSLGCDLNGWSRHHFSCQDFSSCFHVTTCIACRDFFYLRRPLLLLHRQILVATSKLCRDIIYLLLVSRYRNDVAT